MSPSARPRRRRLAGLVVAAFAATIPAVVIADTPSPSPTPAGPTWTRSAALPGLSGRIWKVAFSPATAGLVLAATDNGVYTSSDSGHSWAQSGLAGQTVWTVGFDNSDAHAAYAGTRTQGIERSTDSGKTWSAASTGLPNHDVRSLAFGLQAIAAGTDAGVAVSSDGSNWHDIGLDDYAISGLAVAANSPQLVLVAGVDNGDVSKGWLYMNNGGGTGSWQVLTSGIPASATVSSLSAGPISPSVTKRPLFLTVAVTTTTTSNGAFHSGDGGNTWSPANGLPESVVLTTGTFSPLDPGLLYAGADGGGSSSGTAMVRSTDGGSNFSNADAGLPAAGKQVESIAVAQTTPPQLAIAVDPPSGPGIVYTETDVSAPAPPQLVAESPGAAVPSAQATSQSTPTAKGGGTPPPTPSASGTGFVGKVFHWPVPLVFEIVVVLALVYGWLRWRQRQDVEGPP